MIYGPRQVGKTTLVQQILAKTSIPHLYATADAVLNDQETWITSQWETARIRVKNENSGEFILVLDEIQKIANWSEHVKREWDTDTQAGLKIKVILLGSSRLLLLQGLTESLTGRFESIYLPHWSYSEMREIADLTAEEYIWFGGYPGSAPLMKDEKRWKDYMINSIIETSISRDILMLTRVDKPAVMRQLFEIGCSYSGQIVSFTKILGQLQNAGNTTTLSHYLMLLDQAGLLAGLSKYSPALIRQRASIPKFQVHDISLKSAVEPLSFSQVRSDPKLWGRWVESAIGAHLLNQSRLHGFKIHYWRDGHNEVDFILERGDKTIALEVKTNASLPNKGMGKFREKFNPDKSLLIGISGIPVEEFLLLQLDLLFN